MCAMLAGLHVRGLHPSTTPFAHTTVKVPFRYLAAWPWPTHEACIYPVGPMLDLSQGCPTGNSHSLLPVWLRAFPSWKFPEFLEFPVPREFAEFGSAGYSHFLSARISDFQLVFCIRKLVLYYFQLYIELILFFKIY